MIKGYEQYKQKIVQDHKTKVVRKYFSLYAIFWFYTEFWLEPVDRRPYTFIFRDWIYPNMKGFLVILSLWYFGMFIGLQGNPYPYAVLIAFSSWVSAHLIWGGTWIAGQQEWPPYLGE